MAVVPAAEVAEAVAADGENPFSSNQQFCADSSPTARNDRAFLVVIPNEVRNRQ